MCYVVELCIKVRYKCIALDASSTTYSVLLLVPLHIYMLFFLSNFSFLYIVIFLGCVSSTGIKTYIHVVSLSACNEQPCHELVEM